MITEAAGGLGVNAFLLPVKVTGTVEGNNLKELGRDSRMCVLGQVVGCNRHDAKKNYPVVRVMEHIAQGRVVSAVSACQPRRRFPPHPSSSKAERVGEALHSGEENSHILPV